MHQNPLQHTIVIWYIVDGTTIDDTLTIELMGTILPETVANVKGSTPPPSLLNVTFAPDKVVVLGVGIVII